MKNKIWLIILLALILTAGMVFVSCKGNELCPGRGRCDQKTFFSAFGNCRNDSMLSDYNTCLPSWAKDCQCDGTPSIF